MSDLCNSCNNSCGCGCDNSCGNSCSNGCGSNFLGLGNGNDCCSLIWILILLSLFCGNGSKSNNSCIWIILLLFFCGGNGCGCDNGCGC